MVPSWFIVAALIGVVRATSKDLADDAEKYLLPWNIRPQHYNLTLYTNIEKFVEGQEDTFVFSGLNVITINILYGDVSEAVIHTYDDVTIQAASVISLDDDSSSHEISVGAYDQETNKQILNVTPPLANNGHYNLSIAYSGRNTDSLRGFYRSSFEENGRTRWLLTTHFESFGARQAFPSFDEPEYKATYQLTIHYNESLAQDGYVAHFNTDIQSEEIRNGVHITTFEKTPRQLSSYLVAIILAPFGRSPEPAYFNSSFNGENGTKPAYTIGQPKYFSPRQDLLSQVASPAALNVITRLTGVGYGMTKMECAGIPDFAPGAMENWGLVTFRESAVFFDEKIGTTQQKQSVTSTITHEFGHQWFGDLVTLHWWTDLWLNEGFATFFATHAANEYREPTLNTTDWDLIGQFVVNTLQGTAFETDAKPDARPLTAEAYLPDTIDEYFDGISYDKGGSVLRMFLHILGSDVFYSGLNRYLRSQEESVGTPEILLASFDGAIEALPSEERPQLPGLAADLFAGWHLQAGYPVLNVTRNGGDLTITQSRFLSAAGDDSNVYNVPLSYSTDLELNFENTSPVSFLLASESATLLRLGDANADWVVINNQATGYYRVNYDRNNWDKLLEILSDNQSTIIHPYNRAQIRDDAADLAASTYTDYLDYSVALELMATLRYEKDPVAWLGGLHNMKGLRALLSHDQYAQTSLDNYLLDIIRPIFEELTLQVKQSDSHVTKILRMKVAEFACSLGLDSCLEQSIKLIYSKSKIHPDVLKTVLCQSFRIGNSQHWDKHFEIARLESRENARDELFSALTCTNNVQQLVKLVEYASQSTTKHDAAITILETMVETSAFHARIVLQTQLSRKDLHDTMETMIIPKAAMYFTDAESMGIPLTSKVLTIIDHNKRWADVRKPAVMEWLSSKGYKTKNFL